MQRWILVAIVAVLVTPGLAPAQETGHKPASADTPADAPVQRDAAAATAVLCPVTGRPVERACVVRFRGRWVYFADDAARKQFEGDPYAYVDGLQRQWEADKPLRVQVKCPVTGAALTENVYVGQGDEAVFFADEEARARFVASPEKYRARLGECYTYQTLCAHSGLPINPQVTLRFQGRTLYFMCPNCRAAFEREPEQVQRDMAAAAERLARRNERAWLEQQLERRRAALRGGPDVAALRAEIERIEKRLVELRAEDDEGRKE